MTPEVDIHECETKRVDLSPYLPFKATGEVVSDSPWFTFLRKRREAKKEDQP